MGFYKKNTGYGKKKGGYKGGFQKGPRGRAEMHSATCSECRSECKVPFKPNGRKPLFCSDCMWKQGKSGKRDEGKTFGPREKKPYVSTPRGGGEEIAKQLRHLNKTMDQILEVLLELGGDVEEGEE